MPSLASGGRHVTALEQLRQALELLPTGSALLLPREHLLAAIGARVQTRANVPAADLTVSDVATRLQRSASTVRAWLEQGRFPGAYHLPTSGTVLTYRAGTKTGGRVGKGKAPRLRAHDEQRPRRGAWRIPPAAFAAFVASQQAGPRATTEPSTHRPGTDTRAWRRQRARP
jgi:hypothetical protein